MLFFCFWPCLKNTFFPRLLEGKSGWLVGWVVGAVAGEVLWCFSQSLDFVQRMIAPAQQLHKKQSLATEVSGRENRRTLG